MSTQQQSDPNDILILTLVGMFCVGSGAAAAMIGGALTTVREALLERGILAPTAEAAIPLGDTGVGLPLWLALALAVAAVAAVIGLMYSAARRRSREEQG
ncbi:hypothetical protein AB0E52_11455 [Micrococcus luteus]|uniref:hypothetical protein n=1 Tax=Micrococcaceae TaxID=1268 RepID=UPI0033168D68